METYYLKNIEESSPVSKIFYSESNVRNISNSLRYLVYKQTNIKIPQVNFKKLLDQMTVIYVEDMTTGSQLPIGLMTEQKTNVYDKVIQLNNKTITSLLTTLISNVREHFANLKELDNPIDDSPFVPINVSRKKTTGNRGPADILFGDDFYK